MFTSNYYKGILKIHNPGGVTKYKGLTGVEQTNGGYSDWMNLGGALSATTARQAYIKNLQTTFSSNGGVVLGTGTTPPSLDDYALSGELITGYTYTSSVKNEVHEDGQSITASYTITNNGSQAFTIGEVGLIASFTGSASAAAKALLERTVLDEPITIAAGGVGQLTYTIRLYEPVA